MLVTFLPILIVILVTGSGCFEPRKAQKLIFYKDGSCALKIHEDHWYSVRGEKGLKGLDFPKETIDTIKSTLDSDRAVGTFTFHFGNTKELEDFYNCGMSSIRLTKRKDGLYELNWVVRSGMTLVKDHLVERALAGESVTFIVRLPSEIVEKYGSGSDGVRYGDWSGNLYRDKRSIRWSFSMIGWVTGKKFKMKVIY